jgi:hypothetical protein
MIERRRAERVPFVHPGVGSLRLVQDVEISNLGPRHAMVLAPGQLPCGERLLLEIRGAHDAKPCTILVRAVGNRPVTDEGALRWHARLEMIQRVPRAALHAARLARRQTVMGALIRRVPVRVVEASTAGCVVESPSALREGTVGFVQTRTTSQDCSEAVRIRRMSETSDLAWPYRMAAEFLTLGPASPDSLRGLATIRSVGSPHNQ